MAQARYWLGSEISTCEVTGKTITDRFVDGRTPFGPWAIMHPDVFAGWGYKPAQGVGQLYEKQPNGKWLKIDG